MLLISMWFLQFRKNLIPLSTATRNSYTPVSYTHLDVYKRQVLNSLEVADNGEITGFKMRVEQSKLTTVKALQSIGFETIASGDSYNGLGMIQASKQDFCSARPTKSKPTIRRFRRMRRMRSCLVRSKRQWRRSKQKR